MADQPETDNAPRLDLNMRALRFNVTERLGRAYLEISFEHGRLQVHTHPSQFGELAEFFKKAQELDWSDAALAHKDFWYAMVAEPAREGWIEEYNAEYEAEHGTTIYGTEIEGDITKTVASKEPLEPVHVALARMDQRAADAKALAKDSE